MDINQILSPPLHWDSQLRPSGAVIPLLQTPVGQAWLPWLVRWRPAVRGTRRLVLTSVYIGTYIRTYICKGVPVTPRRMGLTFWKGEAGSNGQDYRAKTARRQGLLPTLFFQIQNSSNNTGYKLSQIIYVHSLKLVPANNGTVYNKVHISFCIVNQAKNHHWHYDGESESTFHLQSLTGSISRLTTL